MDLPTGTVTFLFTDVEGSTRLAKALGAARVRRGARCAPAAASRRLSGCRRRSRSTRQGDGFFVAFRSASEAVRAAAATQRALAEHRWPEDASVRVRIGIHTGEAAVVDDGYRGLAVHRAARICASAHGGQVLLSATTRDSSSPTCRQTRRLRDLGLVQLRDIDRPERLFQLVVEGLPEAFPPPRATAPRQVAAHAADLLERDAELAALDALIAAAAAGGRLLAIEGPAGIGKTRLLGGGARRAHRPPGCRCWQRVAPSSSTSSRTVSCGNSSSLCSPRCRRRAGRTARRCRGACDADLQSRPPRRRAGCGRLTGDAPRSLLADREPRRAPGLSCLRSTICTGAIRPRCAGSRTCCREWRVCRS